MRSAEEMGRQCFTWECTCPNLLRQLVRTTDARNYWKVKNINNFGVSKEL